MILFKKRAKHKVKSYIYCIVWASFRARNVIKNETKKVNKTVSFAQFPWFFLSWDLKTQKIASRPPVFNLDLHIFSYNKQSMKI